MYAWLPCALQMSFSSAAHILNNRAIFPAFFRTIPSFEHLAQALVACMEKFNWTQLAVITQLESGFIGVSNLHTHSMSCFRSNVSKVNCEGMCCFFDPILTCLFGLSCLVHFHWTWQYCVWVSGWVGVQDVAPDLSYHTGPVPAGMGWGSLCVLIN